MIIEASLIYDNEQGLWGVDCVALREDRYSLGGPLLIAHDLIEHVNGVDEIGGFEDELMAVGAYLFGRYNYVDGFFVSDIHEMITSYNMHEKVEVFERYEIDEVIENYRGEFDRNFIEDLKEESHLDIILGVMSEGFRRASEIWKDQSYDMHRCMEKISERLARVERSVGEYINENLDIEIDTEDFENIKITTLGDDRPEVHDLLDEIGELLLNDSDEILDDYKHFEAGTSVHDIKEWVDETYNVNTFLIEI